MSHTNRMSLYDFNDFRELWGGIDKSALSHAFAEHLKKRHEFPEIDEKKLDGRRRTNLYREKAPIYRHTKEGEKIYREFLRNNYPDEYNEYIQLKEEPVEKKREKTKSAIKREKRKEKKKEKTEEEKELERMLAEISQIQIQEPEIVEEILVREPEGRKELTTRQGRI